MPYLDKLGEHITFERKAGEDMFDPEHAVATCPQCGKVAACKSKNRSVYGLANTLKWLVLPTTNVLYCSRECAFAHDSLHYQVYIKLLEDEQYKLSISLRKWHFKE